MSASAKAHKAGKSSKAAPFTSRHSGESATPGVARGAGSRGTHLEDVQNQAVNRPDTPPVSGGPPKAESGKNPQQNPPTVSDHTAFAKSNTELQKAGGGVKVGEQAPDHPSQIHKQVVGQGVAGAKTPEQQEIDRIDDEARKFVSEADILETAALIYAGIAGLGDYRNMAADALADAAVSAVRDLARAIIREREKNKKNRG